MKLDAVSDILKFNLSPFFPADSPLDSPSGTRKSVRVSRYFEDGPLEDSLYSKNQMTTYSTMPAQTNGSMYSSSTPGMMSCAEMCNYLLFIMLRARKDNS